MLTQNQLKTAFSKYGFKPLKRLGENYLIDANIKDKIIAEAAVGKDDVVLEIGPGFGALTIDLAKTGAKVFAVEKDKLAFAALKDIAGTDFPNLTFLNDDVLKFDIEGAGFAKKIKIIGSLPYYITTPIIEYLVENRSRISSAVMVVQKEFADRLSAEPGTKPYGAISCFVRYYASIKYIYTIKGSCFYPSPDVDSALMRMDMLDNPSVDVKDEALFFRIIRGAFNQRRKSIINSLSRESVLGIPKPELSMLLSKSGIDPAARPEKLGLSDFAKIANLVKSGALW